MRMDIQHMKSAGCVLDSGFAERASRYTSPQQIQSALAALAQSFERDNRAGIDKLSICIASNEGSIFYNCAENTVYDLASVTKVFTLKTVYELAREGKLDLSRELCCYLDLPDFAGYRIIDAIQMRGSIKTRGRLSLCKTAQQLNATLKTVYIESYSSADTTYTDIGFILLGRLIEKLTGLKLPQAIEKYVTAPLKMRDTGFLPRGKALLGNGNKIGLPHDFKTRTAGGATGAAGLFSTVCDLNLLCRAFIDGRFFDKEFLDDIFSYSFTDSHRRVKSYAGMYIKSPPEIPTYTARCFSDRVIGHHGFTGSNFVADLKTGVSTALLVDAIPDGAADKHPDFLPEYYRLNNAVSELALIYAML